MATRLRTVLYPRHVELGAQIVEFGGWDMPVQYPGGILKEHLATRRHAGLFDVSHMGRLFISGRDAVAFLQHALTNNAAALEPGESQYTIIADTDGGAIDDAYLYRFVEDGYVLVINAANRNKDVAHFRELQNQFKDLSIEDRTHEMAMLSLQGPQSKEMVRDTMGDAALPDPQRNALSVASYNGDEILIARTGYTGEPLCFELFLPTAQAPHLWDTLIGRGAKPVGLGARDTLRLEAGLPLYGHELGKDPLGNPIPVYAISLARFAVSFTSLKGNFVGKTALLKQFHALQTIISQKKGDISALPRRVRTIELTEKGIARAGAQVFFQEQPVGHITSGTMVPMWEFNEKGLEGRIDDQNPGRRAIALALIDSRIADGAEITIEVRKKHLRANVMPYLLRSEAPPFARPITWQSYLRDKPPSQVDAKSTQMVRHWVQKSIENTLWRQQQCINLIPSEMTTSSLVRMLSIMDPTGRYAEHKPVKAFADAEIFYYQGTEFIAAVEAALIEEIRLFLNCGQVETRSISGQMANMIVFSAMVDFLNRGDRKTEQRRISRVMNHHIIKGGHLSSQPMGALRDYIMRDPVTERPSVVNFPVLPDNPYQVDVEAIAPLLERYKPELIILGKSMTLHKEPVAPIRKIIDEINLDTVLMYDMAHVIGLAGPSFQQPFAEGADIVTGSTHKTFFGTQRGVVAADLDLDHDLSRDLWEAVNRRAFPGSTSNHHLGTLLGLLIAAKEMNTFKDDYQPRVIANAKAFAMALKACGLAVAGDPDIGYTETHQVIVKVGYAQGPAIARDLEQNNIICNYQASPMEEGFTASGALRLGVAEMTRFGMLENDFQSLAQLMADVIINKKDVRQEVTSLRQKFLEMRYCFSQDGLDGLVEQLHGLI